MVSLCVQFPFSLEPRPIFVVATVKKELNNRVCVCLAASGWSTAAACCIIIASCPSPLTSYSSNCVQREQAKKARGRENE